jgi:hypothetical protein
MKGIADCRPIDLVTGNASNDGAGFHVLFRVLTGYRVPLDAPRPQPGSVRWSTEPGNKIQYLV